MKIRKALLLMLALALLCVAGAALAEDCPHNGTTTTEFNSIGHWHVCNLCGERLNYSDHYAYCDDRTHCKGCEAEFEPTYIYHHEVYEGDADYHWSRCKDCGETVIESEEHFADCNNLGTCVVCHMPYEGSGQRHQDEEWTHDENGHWLVCSYCGIAVSGRESHIELCSELGVCHICGATGEGVKLYTDHAGPTEWTGDETTHTGVCGACGEISVTSMHFIACTNLDEGVCGECGLPFTPASEDRIFHSYDWENLQYDEEYHWTTCYECGEEYKAHHWWNCVTPGVCVECGQPYTDDNPTHYNGPSVYFLHDETKHWNWCDYCERTFNVGEHYTNPGTPEGVCSFCGAKYGAEEKPAFALNGLTTDVTTATVGQQITVTANMTAPEAVLEMEYHVYNQLGQHISGWNGISGVYYYTATEPGAYTFRVYVRTADGWVNTDSKPVTVTAAAASRKAVALQASGTTAKVGDTLTFTTQFEGDGEIAWIEYHIYDTYGQHVTGYRGEGDGISGVYNYPTANTGAGKYTARVYLMAKDGTFTQVDSVQVTVTGGTRKAVALNPNSTTAKVGDTLVFTTQFEGDGPIAWIEYHIYDASGNHLTGYRGEGAGISGVYNYPTATIGAGKYTARVYLMAQDGTFTQVDSVQVTVE